MRELIGLFFYAFFASWAIMIVVNLRDSVATGISRAIVAFIALILLYVSGICLYVAL